MKTEPHDETIRRFHQPRFPRASSYDPMWVARNQMGPNVLWLCEWLNEALKLEPGSRVLDMGCGRAISSIFLAKEFDVTVFATDLWISAADNWTRIVEAGVQDKVVPIHAEAHALPFAEGFFDAIVSYDSYAYYGTDDLYLSYFIRFLKPGGHLGVVLPGLTYPLDAGGPPEYLTRPQANGKVFWEPDCATFHTAAWWRSHWEKSTLVEVKLADTLPDGWRFWADHERAVEASGFGVFPSETQALETDAGRHIGFVRAVAERRAVAVETTAQGNPLGNPHVWEPGFMAVCAELMEAAHKKQGSS